MQDGIGRYSLTTYLSGYSWLHSLAYTFNEALYDLDMHVDVDPTWTPKLPAPPLSEDTLGRITKIEEVE